MIDKIQWLGHASFKILAEKVIYIDPWEIKGEPQDADLIFVTHEHYDHCSIRDMLKIKKENTKIVAPYECKPVLETKIATSDKLKFVKPKEKFIIEGTPVETVPAYNIGKQFHEKSAGHVGYIITALGKKIYHAGDTDFIPEMKEVKCDIALLPIGGTYTMSYEDAAKAAEAIKPEIVIPMHYGKIVGSSEDVARFKKLYSGKVVVLTPQL
mgnify:CR=1 FL=1